MTDRTTAAREAYEEDLRRWPSVYRNGRLPQHKAWEDLDDMQRESWKRNPTPRDHDPRF